MATKYLYRIEHPSDGKGIWNSRDDDGVNRIEYCKFEQAIEDHHYEYPGYIMDNEINKGKEGNPKDYFYAAKSKRNFAMWFPKEDWLRELVYMGFRVYRITVTEFLKSKYQAAYKLGSIVKKEDVTNQFVKPQSI